MKRYFTFLFSLILIFTYLSVCVLAEDSLSAEIYVTISDGEGKLAVTQEKITVVDADEDDMLTINDALWCAHENEYEGGAESGYNSYFHDDYGLSLDMLWGNDSGSFGYYVNNTSAWSLADPIKDGDSVYAFVYTDQKNWSDTYCYFDMMSVSVGQKQEIIVKLMYADYDAEWNPVTLPVENAIITVNGCSTEIKTDAEGKAVISFKDTGKYILSAESDSMTLVPPVCVVSVNNKPNAGDEFGFGIYIVIAMLAVASVGIILKKKRVYEI